jgi:hypothetical protein
MKKITGFFALFDILGFQQILENMDLDYLESRITNLLDSLHKQAITMNGIDCEQQLSFQKTDTIVFSDTIILYQTSTQFPDGTMPFMGPSIIDKSALLLRLAFEEGIPLRGAISYGNYLVSDNYFLGKPIVEAYQAEQHCKWSGAILCKSAECECKKQKNPKVNLLGIESFPLSLHPCTSDLIIRYPGPYADPKATSSLPSPIYALRWDDWIKIWANVKDIPDLSFDDEYQIEERVKEKFYAHGKEPNEKSACEKVNHKITNTVEFTAYCSKILPSSLRLAYYPDH